MNTIHNNGDNDQALNDGLEKLGQAYIRLEQDEPPELLDQAILSSAHRAAEKKSGWKDFGWMHGLATAAVFVLALTIILDQRELAPEFKAPELEDDVLRNAPSRSNRESAHLPQAELRRQRVQSAAIEKNERADKDDTSANYLLEEIMMDEADVLTESPPLDVASVRVAAPVTSAMKASDRINSAIEKELQAIIELKKTGNETWLTELEAFVARNPDYPLPEELKH